MVAIVAITITALVVLALVWAARMAHLRNARVTRDFEALRAAYAELEVAKAQAEARSLAEVAVEQKAPDHALNSPTLLRESLARSLRRSSVLLIEDISTNRVLTAPPLRCQGHRVDVAHSGIEGLRMVTARPYDVVFLDLATPGIDGYETARRMRALPGPGGAVPIVALTASDSSTAHAACLEAGMNGILAKPVRPQELSEMLGRVAWAMPASGAAPAAVSPGSEALVNSDRLADLQRSLPNGLFETLVQQCLVDIRDRLPLLQDALRNGSPAAAHEVAHALAGMAGSYGLTLFERRMRDIMVATAVSDMAVAVATVQGIESELDRSAELIRALLRAHAA